jgi:hypothetical protein
MTALPPPRAAGIERMKMSDPERCPDCGNPDCWLRCGHSNVDDTGGGIPMTDTDEMETRLKRVREMSLTDLDREWERVKPGFRTSDYAKRVYYIREARHHDGARVRRVQKIRDAATYPTRAERIRRMRAAY